MFFQEIRCNFAFCFLFTGLLRLDTVGAALATLIANTASLVLSALYIFKHYKFLWFKNGVDIKASMCFESLKIGFPLAFQWSVLFIGSFVQASVINAFPGGLATKATSCYSPFESYVGIPFSSLAQAALSYVGQNYGAKNIQRIRQGIKSCGIIVIILYIIVLPIFLLLIPVIPYIFIPSEELAGIEGETIIRYVSTYLYILFHYLYSFAY